MPNRPFSYSEKESESNHIFIQKFRKSTTNDRSSNATRSKPSYKMHKNNGRSRRFVRIDKMSIRLIIQLQLTYFHVLLMKGMSLKLPERPIFVEFLVQYYELCPKCLRNHTKFSYFVTVKD